MRRNKSFDYIIAALIGVIAASVSIYIIWAAVFVMRTIGDMLG